MRRLDPGCIATRRLAAALALTALAACAAPRSQSDRSPAPAAAMAGDAPRRVNAVADDYYQAFLQARPLSAFQGGQAGTALDRLDANSLADVAAWNRREDSWLARLLEIQPADLAGSPERITYAVLRTSLESAVARRVCREELWPVVQQGGVQQLPGRLASIQPVGTPALRAAALARLRAFGPFLETEIANLREGIRLGFTAPRGIAQLVIAQLDVLLATPAERSPVLLLARRDSTPEFRDSLVAVVARSLHPALGRYRDYLRVEYLPRARAATAVSALPRGQECYRARLLSFTTLPLDPATVHRTGLEQMELIERQAAAIATRLFGTADMAVVWRRLQEDPAFRFGSREEVVDTAEAALARARQALPRWFGRLPRATMIVEPCFPFEEKSGCPNSYSSAAEDGSRPGRWRINTNPRRASRVDLESIAFHEGYPGHHLDRSLAQERPGSHPVTRIIGNAGFSEGWGLYAEDLANEMGLYSGDLAQLGRLSSAAFRAARLVVDPGLHALGWSRERAIEYMLAHTARSRESVESEVDRYIGYPGQATAYMTGRLEIGRLRAEAERKLGERFDIRTFHDRVLGQGRVPLPVLREEVEGWIARRGQPAE